MIYRSFGTSRLRQVVFHSGYSLLIQNGKWTPPRTFSIYDDKGIVATTMTFKAVRELFGDITARHFAGVDQ